MTIEQRLEMLESLTADVFDHLQKTDERLERHIQEADERLGRLQPVDSDLVNALLRRLKK